MASPALLGYARVSTDRQSLDQQLDALTAAGVDPARTYVDKISGVRDDRPGLAALLDYAREGDVIVVWRLDRLGRSLSHIARTIKELRARDVHVRSIVDGADSSTSTGRLMIGILASMAEYERELIAERSAIAREARAARGTPTGRPRALSADEERRARTLAAAGETVEAIRDALRRPDGARPGRSTVYRVLAANRPSQRDIPE